MPRITATMMMLCIALFGSTAHGSSLRGGRKLNGLLKKKENGHECTYDKDCVSEHCVSDDHSWFLGVNIYHCRACSGGGTYCLPTPKPTPSPAPEQYAATHGEWECFMTNGIASESLAYGFSTTDGTTATQQTQLGASLAVSQTFQYESAGVKGETQLSLTGSIQNTWSTTTRESDVRSTTTTVSTKCQAEFCPTVGSAKSVNICQWTVRGEGFHLASQSILFAPAGKKPNCPVNPELPGSWCDTTVDSWCSRCTLTVCASLPGLPGCSWYMKDQPTYNMFAGVCPAGKTCPDATYALKSLDACEFTTNGKTYTAAACMQNEANPEEWIVYKGRDDGAFPVTGWYAGNKELVQAIMDVITGKHGALTGRPAVSAPPTGSWTRPTSWKVQYQGVEGKIPVSGTCTNAPGGKKLCTTQIAAK